MLGNGFARAISWGTLLTLGSALVLAVLLIVEKILRDRAVEVLGQRDPDRADEVSRDQAHGASRDQADEATSKRRKRRRALALLGPLALILLLEHFLKPFLDGLWNPPQRAPVPTEPAPMLTQPPQVAAAPIARQQVSVSVRVLAQPVSGTAGDAKSTTGPLQDPDATETETMVPSSTPTEIVPSSTPTEIMPSSTPTEIMPSSTPTETATEVATATSTPSPCSEPTIVVEISSLDTTINGRGDSAFTPQNNAWTGHLCSDSHGQPSHGLFWWPFPELKPKNYIESTKIRLTVEDIVEYISNESSIYVRIYPLLSEWAEDITFADACQGSLPERGEPSIAEKWTPQERLEADITPIARAWAMGMRNYGILIEVQSKGHNNVTYPIIMSEWKRTSDWPDKIPALIIRIGNEAEADAIYPERKSRK